MNEITLDLLRQLVKEELEYYESLLKQIADKTEDADPVTDFDFTRLALGKILAYQGLIKHMRNLSDRQFRMEIKKGTL